MNDYSCELRYDEIRIVLCAGPSKSKSVPSDDDDIDINSEDDDDGQESGKKHKQNNSDINAPGTFPNLSLCTLCIKEFARL